MSTPTPSSIQFTSPESVQVTMSDGSILQCGSYTNAVANKNAPVQMLHNALVAFFAALTAAVTAANAAATAAQSAQAAQQAKFNTLVTQFLAANGNPSAQAAIVQQVIALTSAGITAAANAQIAKHNAAIAALQGTIAAVAPAETAPLSEVPPVAPT
ncbi:MAG: hypothetical protein WBD81_18035 [Collimonas pratensis]|uniref:hypothetical protein n=1 Tax=Collimonas pratensis TaxID=279113 RepID=UPI003C74CC74